MIDFKTTNDIAATIQVKLVIPFQSYIKIEL